MRTRFAVILTTAVFLGAWPASSGGARPEGGVRLTYGMPDRVSLHEPVIFSYTVGNDSLDAVQADFGRDRIGAFHLDVTRPDGRQQGSYDIIREGLHRVGTFTIPRRGTYSQTTVVDQWIDLSVEGTYSIRVKFSGVLHPAIGVNVDFEPEHVFQLQVTARAEAHLREVCTNYAILAQGKGVASEDAIEALGYVRDPVAIPFLVDVLMHHQITTPPLIAYLDVLGRIGGPEGRAALQQLSTSDVPWIAFNAKRSLEKLK